MTTPSEVQSIPQSDSMSTSSSTKSAIVTPGSGSKCDESPKLDFVLEPHDNDVLCGRGGSINSHPGNERFRQLVEKRKRVYLTARFKREKRLIANSILSEIRSIDPPGRFLSKDPKTGSWYDIGDEKARDKTSQALRENAPSIRAEIEVEINQQRAEMQRAEDEEAAMAVSPPGPPHPYYQQPWGFYAPYHGYGQYHAEPPPSQYGHDERYERQWQNQYPEGVHGPNPSRSPSSVHSRTGDTVECGQYNDPHRHINHTVPGGGAHSSGFDVPNFVSSVPSSLAAWTRTSFSFGGHSDHLDHNGQPPPPPPKPLPYVHDPQTHDQGDHREGRRMVHFEDDRRSPSHRRASVGHYGQQRYNPHVNDYYGYTSPIHSRRDRQHGNGSAFPSTTAASVNANHRRRGRHDQAIEPLHAATPYQDGEQQSSRLSQVANHILGSWDTSMVCASSTDEATLVMPGYSCPSVPSTNDQVPPPVSLADAMEDEEGQEVELVDMMNFDDADDLVSVEDDIRDDEHRVPPPETDKSSMPPPPRRIEIDWPSKMLGCQSNWLPETFNAPSFFGKNNPLSPSASLDMDTSAVGTEGISTTGSIGGASLCQVFSQEQLEDRVELDSPTTEQQGLSQMPSWERSVRSKSPSTICSEPSVVGPSSPGGEDYALNQ